MQEARALLEVTAGIIPNRPEPELTKQWAITSAEWQQATADNAQGALLSQRNGQAIGYASWLAMQPDRCNWVRFDWLWL
jgi:hypothetical protein